MKMRVYTGKLTMDERLFIHCYYTKMSRKEMATYLGVSIGILKSYIDKFAKLRVTKEQKNEIQRRVRFKTNKTDQFDDFIKSNYMEMSMKEIARKINKSDGFVRSRLKDLGLYIPEEILEERQKGTLFKKGRVSPNKGKPVSADTYKKISKSFFKKGHRPHNQRKDWDEVVAKNGGREYWMIKIPSKTKMVFKHRWLWELCYGPIPERHSVRFKDGNTLNCVIENLYLISLRDQMVENAMRPSAIAKRFLKMNDEEIDFAKKHAPEILELKTAAMELKIKLNKIKKNDDK